MKNKILFSLLVVSLSLNAMQVDNDEVKQITDELLLASRSKYEKKVKEGLKMPPLKENSSLTDFPDYRYVARLCKPRYSVLLKTLLGKKIISPNASFTWKGITVNLLIEAIKYSEFLPDSDTSAVKILLDAGASTTRAGGSLQFLPKAMSEWNSNLSSEMEMPLFTACRFGNIPLASLLIGYKAPVNSIYREMTILTQLVDKYILYKGSAGISDGSMAFYRMIELLVQSGADENIPSKYLTNENRVCTAMQLARENGCSEIVALFEQNKRK